MHAQLGVRAVADCCLFSLSLFLSTDSGSSWARSPGGLSVAEKLTLPEMMTWLQSSSLQPPTSVRPLGVEAMRPRDCGRVERNKRRRRQRASSPGGSMQLRARRRRRDEICTDQRRITTPGPAFFVFFHPGVKPTVHTQRRCRFEAPRPPRPPAESRTEAAGAGITSALSDVYAPGADRPRTVVWDKENRPGDTCGRILLSV
ncbi:hypothetical protein LX36DRAFT_663452 [Colletotrichum falcatum]|nr:hypothetical protein LX36DRAFT_663452 [Colletotrichum falcatum]